MANYGILAALAALLAGSSIKQYEPGSSLRIGKPWLEPETIAPPAPPATTQTTRPTGSILMDIAPPSSPMPEPTNPAPMIPVTTPAPPAKKRTWFTSPNAPIAGREPTPEEKESGLGCPEIPGIWDPVKMNPPARFCANPECPSNKDERDPYTGEIIPATPARLNIIVNKATGEWIYNCPVCRTDQ